MLPFLESISKSNISSIVWCVIIGFFRILLPHYIRYFFNLRNIEAYAWWTKLYIITLSILLDFSRYLYKIEV